MDKKEIIELVNSILEKAKDEGENSGAWQTQFYDGIDCGYVEALEDLLILLRDENRNDMHRPYYYLNVTHNCKCASMLD